MKITRAATTIHKWLALLMAVQILFWVASGFFFAAVPIERVRSEHRVAEAAVEPISIDVVADGLARLAAAGVRAERVEVSMLLGRPVATVSDGETSRLYDLKSAQVVSPISAGAARKIAERSIMPASNALRVVPVSEESTEYRGALPAWRVDFDDDYSVYVAADTGKITARRSDLWRVYDFLWALHIMDYRGHEDFNTPLLVAASLFGLIVVASGIVMLPSRFRLRRRKRALAGHPVSAR